MAGPNDPPAPPSGGPVRVARAPVPGDPPAKVPSGSPPAVAPVGMAPAAKVPTPWKDRLRKWAPYFGYPVFYVLCLLVFFPLTFPYDVVKDKIVASYNQQQRTASSPQQLEIDELDSSFFTGVKAKGIRLVSPPPEVGNPPTVVRIDEARARISLLSLLAGNRDVSFTVLAFDGTIKGNFEDTGKQRTIEINFDGVDLARVDAIAAQVGFPLDGKLYGDVKLVLPEGKASKGSGAINLEIRDLYAGNQKELTVKTPLGPFTLPRLKIGTMSIIGEAKDGVLKLTNIANAGGEVEVSSADGRIQMRELATEAHLDVPIKFKIGDGYRSKNEKTKMLFGTPGGKDTPMLEMDPKIKRSKTADGFYSLRIGGTLAKPDPQPSGGSGASPFGGGATPFGASTGTGSFNFK